MPIDWDPAGKLLNSDKPRAEAAEEPRPAAGPSPQALAQATSMWANFISNPNCYLAKRSAHEHMKWILYVASELDGVAGR